ncbi:LysR substrate binding domain-containing protein [Actinacidiphila yanglinensis]|uniref:LysR substrate binding domain-containing protein n=1 Tax=Actinacidiphila yanglinensis TaxID=310779 RepID=A0A1H6E1J6_9ACTN|nr:LysR substrate binding domain-containing protein [Actinacidiphila yanglinensis]
MRIWNERLPEIPLTLVPVAAAEAFGVLRDGGASGADAGFVRLPVDGPDLSAIPLYTETTVVVVPKDHLVAAVDEVTLDDLTDEIVLDPLDSALTWETQPGQPAKERPATTADAVELVAAGVGLLLVPQSLARLHHRRDLTYRPVPDAPESRVALSWPQSETTDLVEHLIGIVRGRTVNSTRGRPLPAQTAPSTQGAQGKDKRPDKAADGRRKPARGGSGSGARSAGKGGSTSGARRGKPRRRS